MKVCLIFALMAISSGFSEPENLEKEDIDVKPALKQYFNITDEMGADCEVVDENKDSKLQEALFSDEKLIMDVLDKVMSEAKNSREGTDEDYDDLIKTHCLNNDEFQNEKINIIETALPCIEEEKLSELLQWTMNYTCRKIKAIAKFTNA
ncbi:uncharacterized protein LOC117178799 [Belonocnema kinseyi]|uniref:uncharacterized protein LOC117178799 n=1 Tax=Belonocnema kinseyi TaxID=2817044 RepID=UPI00143CDD81|nr:uncharacterized protein LOC117178799 [Belonocnema kinseyi]